MRLESLAAPAPDQRTHDVDLVVIDTEPFLVARVQANINLEGISEVGNWTGDDPTGASWELKDLGGGFDLILPPQGVGEEFLRTYEDGQDENALMDYKFSPPAVFKLTRTAFQQAFSEAPWNLRRLFGFPGQRQPGMGIHALDFELMYGLSTNIQADPDELKLTELNAVVGRLPQPLEKNKVPVRIENLKGAEKDFLGEAYHAYRDHFARELNILKTRLALLQPRSAVQKSPFLTLERGVSYRFREGRQSANPFEPREVQKKKLRGGVDWGFTSQNIYNEVTGFRFSSSGMIVNPSFTALGGNGFQKAGFANDKSTLYTDTFLGRTFFYSLERIGRIGMLWNTAKHVIIYERTVVHTDQFNDGNKWLGRAVMRKVREYVEILQPDRSYPEFGEAPSVRGFARASKFPQKVILVDSKWGRDIAGGWVVPLYHPAANPEVYKKPQVLIKLSTSEKTGELPAAQDATQSLEKSDAEKPFVWGMVTNPEDLLFYTSTDPKMTKDTDLWPPAVGVDFPLAEIPVSPDDQNTPVKDNGNLFPGYERFTLKLDTGKVPINLLAERLDATADAVVENVTLVRRALGVAGDLSKIKNATQQSVDLLITEGRQYQVRLQDEIGSVVKTIEDAGAKVEDISTKIKSLGGSVTQTLESLKTKYQALSSTGLPSVLGDIQNNLRTTWETRYRDITNAISRDIVDVMAQTATDLQARRAEINQLFDHLELQVESARTILDEVRDASENAAKRLNGFAKEKRAGFEKNINDALKLLSLPNPKIDEYRVAVVAALTRLEKEFAEIRKFIRGIEPFILDQANEVNLWDRVHQRYIKLIQEVLPDLTQLDQAKIDKITKGIREQIEAYFAEVKGLAEKLDPALANPLFKDVFDKVKEFETRVQTFKGLIEDLKTDLIGMTDFNLAKQRFEQLKSELLEKIKSNIFDEVNKVLSDSSDVAKKIRSQAQQALGDIQKASADVTKQINRVKQIPEEVLKGLRLPDAKTFHEKFSGVYNDLTKSAASQITEALAPYERWVKEVDIQNIPKQATEEAKRFGDRALRLLRAHGLPPIGEAINLDKERLAYYFQEQIKDAQGQLQGIARQLENAVDITPAKVLVNRVSDLEAEARKKIKSLGIELPSKRIAEKFLPNNDLLKNFRLKDVLPDFAGINLESIFSDVKFPIGQSDKVKITHGIDPTTHRPWAQCTVEMPLAGDTEVFNVASLAINIVGAFFKARTRIALDASGGMKREVQASIRADWRLTVGGQRVLTIKNSTLHFDDSGKIKFEMGAKDIELAEVLKFITDLLESVNFSNKSGLSFELVKEGMIPVGARAVLNLALPALQTGAFSVSNINLSTFFELALKDGQFYLAIGVGLSTKERPFSLNILCLGGGGWFNVRAMYRPFAPSGRIIAMLSIGISAGAALPFDIGVASGGIYFFVGVGVEYRHGGGNNSLTIILRVSIMGEVVVLGIISIGILMALEARYGEGSLVCTGELRVSIKICWCFTLSVSAGFSITLAGSGGSSGGDHLLADSKPPEKSIKEAVNEYIQSFGG
jgi:ABC-type transporter Mla subunit MlaD